MAPAETGRVGGTLAEGNLVLVLIGGLKFTAIEAESLKPFISSTPILSWMYGQFGVEGASRILGISELVIAAFLAATPLSARAGMLGGPHGGHFLPLEQPERLVDDIRGFLRPLRSSR